MTLIIEGITIPDRKLISEITEIVRETAPELLSPERPSTRSARRAAISLMACFAGLWSAAR